MLRQLRLFVLALTLAGCTRVDEGTFDGKFVTAKTEKGEFRLTLPTDAAEKSKASSATSLDGIVAIARREIAGYSKETADWEMMAVMRAELPTHAPFYTVHFSRHGGTQWIIVPVSFDGRILAAPR